ncbi:Terpene cyclase [Mycena sanguinolenta]|uniref:Terpene synthase n=1 Tax=Mycena sanguinolenta TaxID=230812 RepID=A0A8H7DI29_9AGAR|nr:Terpene cyclase [Mycena sanguinolenta]
MTVSVLRLPDIHERWPFPVAYNRWEDPVSAETLAWLESLSILSAAELKKYTGRINFCLFSSMAYAHFADMEHFRVGCDLLNLLFVVDDVTDEMSAAEVRRMAVISLDGLRNWEIPRPSGEHPAGEMHRRQGYSFSARLHRVASSDVLARFMVNYELYLKAVINEADERDRNVVRPSLDTYLTLRRETGAVIMCFDLLLVPAEIPESILNDARVARVERLGLDLICVGNDILSFNVEQARKATHNAVVVVMHEHGLSVQDAMDFVGRWYCQTVEEFLEAMRDVPPCDSVITRTRVKMYFAGIANWVTCNYEWSLRSGRYFAADQDPQESGWIVPLLEIDCNPEN